MYANFGGGQRDKALTAGEAAADLMQHCRGTLKGASRRLVECVLVLCGDPWPRVSDAMRRRMRDLDDAGLVNLEVIDAVIRDSFAELPRAVRRGSVEGQACAQKLVAAMRVAGPEHVSHTLLTKYGVRSLACSSLVGWCRLTPGLHS